MKSLVCLLTFAVTLLAQLPAPNAAGVTTGHHHLFVTDPAVHRKIWVEVLGATASGTAPIELLKLPGIFLIVSQGKPAGGSEGSAVDHFAFAVKDYNGTRDKLAAAGVKIVRDRAEAPREFVAMFPDEVKVEFYEDTALATPIAHHHIHFSTNDPDGLRDWYVKAFGATVTREGTRVTTTIPGTMLSFRRTEQPAPPTRGRSLDHIGFNVKNVAEYCQKLAGLSITCERTTGGTAPIAMVVDPAGTRIELNQGLESR